MTHPWWKTGVVYQVYPRSFQDANRDGVGDLAGILSRVGYLAHTLGIDAVWLSPFYRSPMADFGYDVADYTDVDPIFGTLEDFDELRAAIHAHGLKLIVDFVPNHSSDQHPWFMESRLSKESPKRDWYVWRDPAPDGGPPNNWLSVFGGSAWTFDEPTGQYYLHSFLEEQPDLNWRNPDVEAAMHDALRFWLDRGVDGFRLDVAHFIMKDPELRDNPLASDAGEYHKDMGDYDTQEHIHDKGHPDVHAAFARIRQVLDEYPDRYSVGEIHEFDWEQWASYYGNGKGLHMPFNFGLLKAKWEAGSVREIVDAVEAAVPDNGWPNYVLGNHDEKRIATRLGEPQSRAAAVLLLTLRGTPTLYYGDELGMREASIPDALQQDPWGQRVPGLGRDGCRTPMQWDASSNAGFTEAAMPWLPVQSGYPHRNVAAEL
ncbi:MAG: alpha-amylase family glycosyl hydrolase, partial [Bacteroidota bacterium]